MKIKRPSFADRTLELLHECTQLFETLVTCLYSGPQCCSVLLHIIERMKEWDILFCSRCITHLLKKINRMSLASYKLGQITGATVIESHDKQQVKVRENVKVCAEICRLQSELGKYISEVRPNVMVCCMHFILWLCDILFIACSSIREVQHSMRLKKDSSRFPIFGTLREHCLRLWT